MMTTRWFSFVSSAVVVLTACSSENSLVTRRDGGGTGGTGTGGSGAGAGAGGIAGNGGATGTGGMIVVGSGGAGSSGSIATQGSGGVLGGGGSSVAGGAAGRDAGAGGGPGTGGRLVSSGGATGTAGNTGQGGAGGSGGTGKGGAGGSGGTGGIACTPTDAAPDNGCSNDSGCPANQHCDMQSCGSSCSCVAGSWVCTDRCIHYCVPNGTGVDGGADGGVGVDAPVDARPAGTDGGTSICPNTSFASGVKQFTTMVRVANLQLLDLNHDGVSDLLMDGVLANREGGEVSGYLNDGSGVFASSGNGLPSCSGFGPAEFAVADLNGDGQLDVVLADRGGLSAGALKVCLSDGTESSPVAGAVTRLQLLDLNGDGRLDVAGLACGSGGVLNPNGCGSLSSPPSLLFVVLNQGGGAWATRVDYDIGADTNVPSLAAADLNGDKRPDLVVASSGTNEIRVLLNQGDGSFAAPRVISSVTNPVALGVADLDGDNKPDLVATSGTGATVNVLPGRGDGTFGPAVVTATDPTPSRFALSDVNGDGAVDLVLLASTTARVLLNDGHGALSLSGVITGAHPWSSLALGDANGDKKPDLVLGAVWMPMADNTAAVYVVPNGCFAGAP